MLCFVFRVQEEQIKGAQWTSYLGHDLTYHTVCVLYAFCVSYFVFCILYFVFCILCFVFWVRVWTSPLGHDLTYNTFCVLFSVYFVFHILCFVFCNLCFVFRVQITVCTSSLGHDLTHHTATAGVTSTRTSRKKRKENITRKQHIETTLVDAIGVWCNNRYNVAIQSTICSNRCIAIVVAITELLSTDSWAHQWIGVIIWSTTSQLVINNGSLNPSLTQPENFTLTLSEVWIWSGVGAGCITWFDLTWTVRLRGGCTWSDMNCMTNALVYNQASTCMVSFQS